MATNSDGTTTSGVPAATMSGTDPNYGVLAANTQPLNQTGLGETRTQSTDVANAQGINTPEQDMNAARAEQGLPPIQYGSPSSDVVSGTDSLRATTDANKASATDLLASSSNLSSSPTETSGGTGDAGLDATLSMQAFGDTAQGQSMLQNINDLNAKLASGELSDTEKASVQSQVDSVKAQYDNLINQAQMQKMQGMAKSIVGAGQRGGFMNTQYAGVAAVAPTVGGTFVGNGGELNRIQSEYDMNIQDLQAKKIQAVTDAQAAAEKAIKTGRQEDLALAAQAYDFAKSVQDDHNKMIQEKVQAVNDYQKQQLDLQKYQRDTAAGTVDAMVKAGVDPSTLPEGYLEDLDRQAGYAPGTSEGLYKVGQAETAAKDAESQLKQANALADVLTKLPVGTAITVDGTIYQSLNKGDVQLFSEDDGKGNTTITSYNKDTGEVSNYVMKGVSKVDGWQFESKNGVSMFVNPNTNETRIIADANQPNNGIPNPTALKQKFADGWKPTDAELKAMGTSQLDPKTGGIQCGQAVRLWSNYSGPSLSSLEAKKALIEPGIGKGDDAPQAGDAFFQNGGSYGHIGMVLGSHKLADGSYQVDVVDANSQGDGTIRYHTINSKDVLGFNRSKFGFKPEYQFGTDASEPDTETALRNFGGTSTTTKPLTTTEKISLDNSIKSDPDIKAFRDATREANRAVDLEKSVEADPSQKNVVDNAIIDLYQKNVNPGAIVRDPTVMRIIGGQSGLDQLTSAVNKALNGGAGITDEQRKNMVKIIQSQADSAKDSFISSADKYKQQFGLSDEDFSSLFPDYSSSSSGGGTEDLVTQYPEYASGIQELLSEGYSEDEIKQMLESNQ